MNSLRAVRNETGGVTIDFDMQGTADALIDELAAGAAHAVVSIADALGTQDQLHETLGREVMAAMGRYAAMELAARDGQAGENAEDA